MNYTITEISNAITTAYAALKVTTEEVQDRTARHADAQQRLTEARQRVIREHAEDPKALGANEAARNARIEELVVNERDELLGVEYALRLSRNAQELARLDVEHWRAQLRAVEAFIATGELEGAHGIVLKV